MSGGPRALKQLLLDLRKYAFSGYVRTSRGSGDARSEGFILLRKGRPEACLHRRGGAPLKGRKGLKEVWQDSYASSCKIELHARVDLEELMKEYADASLEGRRDLVRKSKVPQPVDRDVILGQLSRWKSRGFDVSSVEAVLSGEPASLTVAYLTLGEAIKKAEAVTEILEALDVTGLEARASALREKLRDPLRHPDIDVDLEALRGAIDERKAGPPASPPNLSDAPDLPQDQWDILGLDLEEPAPAMPLTTGPIPEPRADSLEEPPATPDGNTNLIPRFTFDSFVIGPSNRFAQAAALTVAQRPHKAYNPLLVTSPPGLGKTHLLHAIGNEARVRVPERKVLYITARSFATDRDASEAEGPQPTLRARAREVDYLLVDDVQFLDGHPEAQAEFLHTFDALLHAGRQIVLASDRPPKAIPNLDGQLVSRLESGLVADIRPPERETRIAILERRSSAAHLQVGPEVLAVIADLVEDNVRELQGAFNRVVAFAGAMGRPITPDLAREALGGRAAGGGSSGEATPRVLPGRSYLVEEDRPSLAFQIYADAMWKGGGGLVITRMNPARAREKLGHRADRVLWLTDHASRSEATIQPSLERIAYEIEEFITKQGHGAVLLDGFEYLASSNSFDGVLKFVRRIVDTVSESQYVFIICLGSSTVKEQDLRMLEHELEVLHPEKPARRASSPPVSRRNS